MRRQAQEEHAAVSEVFAEGAAELHAAELENKKRRNTEYGVIRKR